MNVNKIFLLQRSDPVPRSDDRFWTRYQTYQTGLPAVKGNTYKDAGYTQNHRPRSGIRCSPHRTRLLYGSSYSCDWCQIWHLRSAWILFLECIAPFLRLYLNVHLVHRGLDSQARGMQRSDFLPFYGPYIYVLCTYVADQNTSIEWHTCSSFEERHSQATSKHWICAPDGRQGAQRHQRCWWPVISRRSKNGWLHHRPCQAAHDFWLCVNAYSQSVFIHPLSWTASGYHGTDRCQCTGKATWAAQSIAARFSATYCGSVPATAFPRRFIETKSRIECYFSAAWGIVQCLHRLHSTSHH